MTQQEKDQLKIDRDIEAFLDAGGKIEYLESFQCTAGVVNMESATESYARVGL